MSDDAKIIKSLRDIMEFKRIKYKKGFSNRSLTTTHKTSIVYMHVLFTMLELMLLDVVDGDTVFLDKKKGSRLYVDSRPVDVAMVGGKGWDEKKAKSPKVDLRASGYRMPIFAFDPGPSTSRPALIHAPWYIYTALVENINAGKKYGKPLKRFWYDREDWVTSWKPKNKDDDKRS